MIASITACSVNVGRGAGHAGRDRRQGGDRRQTADRRAPAATARSAESKAESTRGPGRPGFGDTLQTALVMPSPARTTEAARAFSAGNSYFSGDLINRCI